MSADKKIKNSDLPRPEKPDERNKSQEEYDEKVKNTNQSRENQKKRRINYVVRDLPIY